MGRCLCAKFKPCGSNGVAAFTGHTHTHARSKSPLLYRWKLCKASGSNYSFHITPGWRPHLDVAGIKPRPSCMAIDHSIHYAKAPKLSPKSLKPDTSHRNFCLITSVTSHSLIKSSSFLPKSQKARGLADTEMFNKLNIGLVKPLT